MSTKPRSISRLHPPSENSVNPGCCGKGVGGTGVSPVYPSSRIRRQTGETPVPPGMNLKKERPRDGEVSAAGSRRGFCCAHTRSNGAIHTLQKPPILPWSVQLPKDCDDHAGRKAPWPRNRPPRGVVNRASRHDIPHRLLARLSSPAWCRRIVRGFLSNLSTQTTATKSQHRRPTIPSYGYSRHQHRSHGPQRTLG